MAIITDIKRQQKQKDRFNIYLDEKFVCGLNDETIIKYGIKIGKEISGEELIEIQLDSEQIVAFNKSISLLERKLYSVKQMKDKLKEKGFADVTIEKCIEKLTGYGYLNDSALANGYCNLNKTKSKRELAFKLGQKGISSSVIDEKLYEISKEDEEESASYVAEKYMRNKEKDYKNCQKLFGYLAGKGFDYDIIKKVVNKYNNGDYLDD